MTHGISFLPQLDQIFVMVNGRISEVGTYRELLDRKGAFADFLYAYLETEDEGAEPDDEGTVLTVSCCVQVIAWRTVSEMTCNVSSGTLHLTHSSLSTCPLSFSFPVGGLDPC